MPKPSTSYKQPFGRPEDLRRRYPLLEHQDAIPGHILFCSGRHTTCRLGLPERRYFYLGVHSCGSHRDVSVA